MISTIALIYFVVVLLTLVAVGLFFGTKRFWSIPQKIRVTLMLSLIAAAIIVGYGFSKKAEEKELVWASNARIWSKVPLSVTWNTEEFRPYNATIQVSIDMWNSEVGCNILRADPIGAKSQVRLLSGAEDPCGKTDLDNPMLDKNDAAGTWYCPDGTADVQFQRLDSIDVAYQIISHEFGHVLGLGHDDGGLMRASVGKLNIVVPNPKDSRYLRERYCGSKS